MPLRVLVVGVVTLARWLRLVRGGACRGILLGVAVVVRNREASPPCVRDVVTGCRTRREKACVGRTRRIASKAQTAGQTFRRVANGNI
jgi:hypothetical protein